MQENYGRDLDLNLLRVFVVVASVGSATRAAAQLYLTQPAISAALRRLSQSVGEPLFVRRGRGIALSARGQQLYDTARPLLHALIDATLAPAVFDPETTTSVVRLGLSDAMEGWLLPRLLRELQRSAPRLRVIAVPVQFRTVPDALASGAVELALTVADELPGNIKREPFLRVGYVCLFDPRQVRVTGAITERAYFAHDHVIVSYNADLRGVVEDMLGKQRRVRCAAASFSHIGSLLLGERLLATVPSVIARHLIAVHPQLSATKLPFRFPEGGADLLWPAALDQDPAVGFVRDKLRALGRELQAEQDRAKPRRS